MKNSDWMRDWRFSPPSPEKVQVRLGRRANALGKKLIFVFRTVRRGMLVQHELGKKLYNTCILVFSKELASFKNMLLKMNCFFRESVHDVTFMS